MIADNSAASIEAFVRANVKPGATLLTDGHASYPGLIDYRHDPRVVGQDGGAHRAAVDLPGLRLDEAVELGTYHGLRRKHVDTYLNEYVFRYNRRFYRHVSFETILGLAAHREPASYWDVTSAAPIPARATSPSGVPRGVEKQRLECAKTARPSPKPCTQIRLRM